VTVAVYCKKYDPSQSTIKLSPVRLAISLYFPEEGGYFNLDIELAGVVDVTRSTANMLGTKLEVHLRKAEPGSWSRLFLPKQEETKKPELQLPEDLINEDLGNVDLSDL
jgi:cysteine and histidine-rich domain-containing protein